VIVVGICMYAGGLTITGISGAAPLLKLSLPDMLVRATLLGGVSGTCPTPSPSDADGGR
jgi:hypothetical protein